MIPGNAILLVKSNKQAYFYEYGRILSKPVSVAKKLLVPLFSEKKDEKNCIFPTPQNASMRYALTKALTKKGNLPHHFSPEFIFALKLTEHYDDLVKGIPMFAEAQAQLQLIALAQALDIHYTSSIEALQKIPETYSEHY